MRTLRKTFFSALLSAANWATDKCGTCLWEAVRSTGGCKTDKCMPWLKFKWLVGLGAAEAAWQYWA